jgi:hypothetical protein
VIFRPIPFLIGGIFPVWEIDKSLPGNEDGAGDPKKNCLLMRPSKGVDYRF